MYIKKFYTAWAGLKWLRGNGKQNYYNFFYSFFCFLSDENLNQIVLYQRAYFLFESGKIELNKVIRFLKTKCINCY